MAGTWTELGIPPTADPAAIRRAYATRLKAIRPDTDPQGFAALRAAYEAALDRAARVAVPVEPPETRPAPRLEPASPEPASPEPASPEPASPDRDVMADCLNRSDPQAAADWLLAARAAGRLTLARDIALADQLGWRLASDFSLPDAAVQAAATRLDWPRQGGPEPWNRPLQARLAAAVWLATLQRQARSRWRWLGANGPIVARLLLGRGRLPFLGSMSGDPTLRRRYGEYLLHAPVLAQMDPAGTPVFDPVRLDGIRNNLAPDKQSWRMPNLPRWTLWLGLVPLSIALAWAIDSDLALLLLGGLFLLCVLAGLAYIAYGWLKAIATLLRIVGRWLR